MELPPAGKKKYSFPVILGMNPGEPLSTRGARMRIYNELIRQLDSSGGHYSQDLSEVDLSDPEDVKVSVSDPSGEVLVHLGSSNFLDRYKIYVGHVREWRKQFDKLESVDLRYERQIIVNPDLRGAVKQPPLAVAAAKAAVAAGVKPAALISHEVVPKKTSVRSPATKPVAQPTIKPAAKNKRKWARTKHWKRAARRGRGLAPKAASQVAPAASPSAASAGTAATTDPPEPAKPPSHSLRKKPSPAIAKDQEDP
jgi:cell division protein FtsQ